MAILLVVDDEPGILQAIGRCFNEVEDLTVMAANNAPEAVKILSKETVDCIISDERMPMIAGSVFLRFVKDKYPDIPRIILTGYADQEAAIRAVNEAGVFRYLQKPWNPDDLREVVRQALELRKSNKTNEAISLKMVRERQAALDRSNELEKEIQKRTKQLGQSIELLKRKSETIDHTRIDILNVFMALAGWYDPASLWLGRQILSLYNFMCQNSGVPHTENGEHAALLAGLLSDTQGRFLPLLAGINQLSGVATILQALPENANGTGPKGWLAKDLPLESRLLRIIHDYFKINAHFPGRGAEHIQGNIRTKYDPELVGQMLFALEQKLAAGDHKKVKPEELLPGMVLVKPCSVEDGTLLPEGTILDDVLIARIKELPIHGDSEAAYAVLL